ncbi:MAG: lytic transglycosylase domain-containing protein [Actinomycetota bacterium]|nr:lytic transglycosylase domain-containing protein [Actinomycetota bacterium]
MEQTRTVIALAGLALVGGAPLAAGAATVTIGMSLVAVGSIAGVGSGIGTATSSAAAYGPPPVTPISAAPGYARPIPPRMLALYRWAAPSCPGLPWQVLAGIGRVETDHNLADGISTAGAEGPMQFMPATFAAYGADSGDGDAANIWDPADSVLTAARYLCVNGAGSPAGIRGALWAYNHSSAYGSEVLLYAARYTRLYG